MTIWDFSLSTKINEHLWASTKKIRRALCPGRVRSCHRSLSHVPELCCAVLFHWIFLIRTLPRGIGSQKVCSSADPRGLSLWVAPFCDFHFARHSPSEMQKTYARETKFRICFKNASCNMHFCLHLCFTTLFGPIFSKMCSPPSVGSTFWQNDSKQSALKNVSFESLLGALTLTIPLRRALFRE